MATHQEMKRKPTHWSIDPELRRFVKDFGGDLFYFAQDYEVRNLEIGGFTIHFLPANANGDTKFTVYHGESSYEFSTPVGALYATLKRAFGL